MSGIDRDSDHNTIGADVASYPSIHIHKTSSFNVQDKRKPSVYASSPISSRGGESTSPLDEKRSPIESIGSWLDSHSKRFLRDGEQQKEWKTAFIRFGPLSGIYCMLVAISCIFASLGILAGSNHKPVQSWPVPPSTYLAIFTAIANLSMRYAAIQGVVIAWWVKATEGSSLARLHWDYRSGTTLRGALTAGKYTGLLALASVFSTVVVIDGPLLQRSTSVVPAEILDHPIPLSVSMVQELPRDSTGQWAYEHEKEGDHTWSGTFNLTYRNSRGKAIRNNIFPEAKYAFMSSVIDEWASDAPLHDVVRGCPGTCNAVIRAPALAAESCDHRLHPVNYSTPTNRNETLNDAPPLYHDAWFNVPFLDVSGSHEIINLVTAYATITDPKNCTGYLNVTTCSLVSAIGEYAVSIKNDSVTFIDVGSPKIVEIAGNAQVNSIPANPGAPERGSTLAGLVYLIFTNFGGRVMCSPEPKKPACYSNAYGPFQRYIKHEEGAPCPSWKNPTADMRAEFNKLMVRAGASATRRSHSYLESHLDPHIGYNTTIIGSLTGTQNVFETWYAYFVGAAIVEIMCIALVLPTYWGWWKIGRPCSFSPLEIAKAFESPMLAECNSNSSGRELAEAVGSVRVRYGVVSDHAVNGTAKLAIASADLVAAPKAGMRFDA